MTAHPFTMTFWPDMPTTTGEAQDLSELGLRKFVENALPPPCATMDNEWLQEWKKRPGGAALWSPTTFEGNKRLKLMAIETCALVLDFDVPHTDPQAWLAAVGSVLQGDSWLAHTSVRSSPEAQKWRLIVPLRERMKPDRWELAHRRLWDIVEQRTGFVVDASAADVSRAWVRPILSPVGFYLAHVEAGKLVDGEHLAKTEETRRREQKVARLAEAAAARSRNEVYPPGVGEKRARLYLGKIPPAVEGCGGDRGTWGAALAIVRGFDLDEATALALLGPWNDACVPPWDEGKLLHKIRYARDKGTLPLGYLLRKGRKHGH